MGMKAEEGIVGRLFCGQEVYFSPNTKIKENEHGSWELLDSSDKPYANVPKDGLYFDFMTPAIVLHGVLVPMMREHSGANSFRQISLLK